MAKAPQLQKRLRSSQGHARDDDDDERNARNVRNAMNATYGTDATTDEARDRPLDTPSFIINIKLLDVFLI